MPFNRPLHNQWTRQKRYALLSSVARVGEGFPAADFSWEPETAETPPGSVTFTRATTANVLTTTDGTTNWYQEAKSGEIRYEGLRRVHNLAATAVYDGTAVWTQTGASTSMTHISDGEWQLEFDSVDGGGNVQVRVQDSVANYPVGTRYIARYEIRQVSGPSDGTFRIYADQTNEGTRRDITITSSFQVFATTPVEASTNIAGALFLRLDIAGATTGLRTYRVKNMQIEKIQDTSDAPSAVVDADVTYNANVDGVRYFNTTNGNSVDGNGVVTEATGSTITGGGYLSEPAVTNQLSTVNIADAAWTKSDLTVTDDGVNDLGLVQYTLDAGTNTAAHRTNRSSAVGGAGTGYVIAKQGTGRYLMVRRGAAADDYVNFDLQTGSVAETGAGVTSSFIVDLGNSWYKCGLVTADTDTGFFLQIANTATPGSFGHSFTGANETILVCHAQYENNDFPTSPIVTSGSTVTRNADRLSLTAATVGTDAAPYSIFADQTTPEVQAAALGADDNAIVGFNGTDRLAVATGAMGATGSGLGATVSSTFGPALRHKIAARIDTNDVAVAIEDETTATDSSYTVATGDLDVAHAGSGREHRGKIHKLQVYDTALTNAQLETLA